MKSTSTALVELGKAAGGLVALLGLLSAVVGAAFLFLPGKLPWTSFSADVSDIEVEHNISLEEFSKRPYAQWIGEAPYEPGRTGNVLVFVIESEGFKRKGVDIAWSMYEEPGQRVPEADLNNQKGWPLPTIIFDRRPVPGISGTSADRTSGEIFAPLPNRDGTFFVKVEVWDTEAGIRLSSESSEKFEVYRGVSKPNGG